MLYLSMATLSIPMPKANPVYFSGSYPAFSYTFGLIMPAPRISIHPVLLHTLQPFPPHITQDISISALGSVKGKKLGLSLTFVSGPKTLWMKSSSIPLRSLMRICLSTINPSS